MEKIFIDTGAFVALASERDNHHSDALNIYSNLKQQGALLITTNHIVDETCTWLLRHTASGHQKAVRFGNTILNTAAAIQPDDSLRIIPAHIKMVVIYSSPVLEQLAWSIFSKYDTAGFSFTDCVSFATMQALGIKKAFTFDTHFDVVGFERV